jgi:hypothetical protein
MNAPGQITALLRASAREDLVAEGELLLLVYGDLRRRAASYMRRERPDHTLQPTARALETYLRFRRRDLYCTKVVSAIANRSFSVLDTATYQ